MFLVLKHFFLDGLEDDEQYGYDEEQGKCSNEHTADGAYTQRTVTVGTHTWGKG